MPQRFVLFVKVLADVHSPTLILSALAISIFLFGFSAIMCLKLLVGLLQAKPRIVKEMFTIDPKWQEKLDSDIRKWQTDMKSAARMMEWMFALAILFAGIFVVGVLVTRCDTVFDAV